MRKLLIATSLIFANLTFGQDVHFSMNNEVNLGLNPGNAGLQYHMRAGLNYRSQYQSVNSPYKTFNAGFDARLFHKRGGNAALGIGVQLFSDKSGESNLSLTQGNLNISGILNLENNHRLSVGVMGGYAQRSVDYTNLRWESQYDGAYNSSLSSNELFMNNSFSYFDLGSGIVWSYGTKETSIRANDGVNAMAGFSIYHFGLQDSKFIESSQEKLSTKYVFFSRVELGKRNFNLTFIPELYFFQQASHREILVGSEFRYLLQEGSHFTGLKKSSSVSLGVHYRVQDALVASFKINYMNYQFGFCYDFNVSKLSNWSRTRGGFEMNFLFVTPDPFKQTRAKI